ncbi:MAG: hypothetical protein EOM80_02770 [Erysipelotrichia bacterium]|nr:hypothetical protein [Erysipelotrichia bacterium]
MKKLRLGMMMAGVFVIGGTVFVSSTFAGTGSVSNLQVVQYGKNGVAVAPSQSKSYADNRVILVAPPKELRPAASKKMVTSIKAFAPTEQVQQETVLEKAPTAAPATVARKKSARVAKTAKASKVVQASKAVQAKSAQAPAVKANPKNLFTLVRLLNYAPHPLTEELLKQTPLTMGDNNYWFSLKYDEDWKVINDDEGYIKGISFEIDVMENNKKVRSLKTPKVAIDAAKAKKGHILGIAEVAPYKFTISVEEVTKNKKGISELVFKLDLVG